MLFFFCKSNLGAGWVRNLTKSCYQSPGGNEGASWWVRTRNAHIAHKGKGEKEPSFQLHLHGTVCAPERGGEKKKKSGALFWTNPLANAKKKKRKGEKDPSFQLPLHGTCCAPSTGWGKKKKELCAVLDLPSSIRKTKKKKGR